MKWRAWLLAVPIVALGVYLRLDNLATSPAWYPDEGSNIAIAAALARGEQAYLAFGQSSFINSHPHLFYLLTAALFRLRGVDILWARLVAAGGSLLALILLYPVGRALLGRGTALLAMLVYAIHPAAVAYNRFAFTYNLLAPLYLGGLYALHRYLDADGGQQTPRAHASRSLRWLLVAALCAGLAPVTDVVGLVLPLFLVLALLLHRPRHVLVALPGLALPALAWGLWMWRSAGDAFLGDLAFAFSRIQASAAVQLARLVLHYHLALEYDAWLLLGVVGLLALPDRRSRWLLGGFFFTSFAALMRTVNVAGQSYYYALPQLPFIALGIASLLARGVPWLVAQLEEDLHRQLAVRGLAARWRGPLVVCLNVAILFVTVVSFFASATFQDLFYLRRVSVVWRLEEGGMLADPYSARQAAAYVNAHTASDDVVLSSPTIAWLFEAQAADFQMALAATGQATQHFPAGIPAERFRFDPRLENASYVVLDPLWRGWASQQMPAVAAMVQAVEREWVLEARFGAFEVYRRPTGVGQ